jgi:hypothetical protein
VEDNTSKGKKSRKDWRGAKAGDPEGRPRYVALYHAETDSMAFKVLSPAAVWLLVQIRRAWRGSDLKIELPFAAVSWKLSFGAFKKARAELIEYGFVDLVNPGGLSVGGQKNPSTYALSQRWRQKDLLERLAETGYVKEVRMKEGTRSVWYPARPLSESQENLKKALASIARKRSRRRPAREALEHPGIETTAASVRHRLRKSIRLMEREEGHG